jgi:putative acetyltransferase
MPVARWGTFGSFPSNDETEARGPRWPATCSVPGMATNVTTLERTRAPAWAIRAEQPLDLDAIHELHRDAFRRPAEAELVDAIRASANFVPELSLVAATEDGAVLGHVLLSRIEFQPEWQGTDAGHHHALALAPLAVLPALWGYGIGSALVRAALTLADERDEPFLAVRGGPDYFGRFGFSPAEQHGIVGPYDQPLTFQVRPRGGAGAVPAGRLVYPPAFEGV